MSKTRLIEALRRTDEIREVLVTEAAYLLDEFDELVAAARGYQAHQEMSFEYQVGINFTNRYDNLRDALDRAEYLNGPHLEQLKKFAEMEQAQEDELGVFTTNTYRRAYTKALEEKPVQIMVRRVSPWRRP